MQKLKNHNWFWMVSMFFLILTIMYSVYPENAELDVNIHNTYFVIPNTAITKIFVALYFIVGLIHWLLYYNKISLQAILSKLYAIVTIGSVLIYFIGKFSIERRIESNFPLFDGSPDLNLFIVIIVLIVFATQIILIINIIISLVKHYKFITKRKQ